MSEKIKITAIQLTSKNNVAFYRLWNKDCNSHKIENGGHGWCRMIAYKVRPYWYKKLKYYNLPFEITR